MMKLVIVACIFQAVVAKESGTAEVGQKLARGMSTDAASAKAALESQLKQYVEQAEQAEKQELKTRENRWNGVISKQQQALVEEESQIQKESKELERLRREKQWQKQAKEQEAKIEAEKQQMEALKSQVGKECASMKTSVQAFIVESQDQAHASCLKGQLGACAAKRTQNHESDAVQECKEASAGWQKKCLADRLGEMTQCAPAGADWAALRGGQKGVEADNAALQHLSNWCTFHKLLAKVNDNKETTPYALLLNKEASVSKDAMSKVDDYAETFGAQPWDMVKVDGNAQSIIVRSQNAWKIQEAMQKMKAKPLDMLPQALIEVGVDVKDWTAGVSDGSCFSKTKLPEFK